MLLVRHPPFLELCGAGCVSSASRTPIPPRGLLGRFGSLKGGARRPWALRTFSPIGDKRDRRMHCNGLSRGPTTSSTPEFGQVMGEEGGLIWRRKGRQNEQRRTALETGSRFKTGSQKSERNGKRLVSMNTKTYPVENKPVPVSPPPYARAGTGFPQALKKGGNRKKKAPARANSKAQSEDRLPGRQPYASAPPWETLTNWRNAQTVRVID